MSDRTPSADVYPDDVAVEAGVSPIGDVPLEASEADVVEQRQEVPLDEDERPY